MGRDMGTYHLRVELMDGRGWIQKIPTGWRYTHGSDDTHPLTADPIPPAWGDEAELFECLIYQNTEGNFSCDCNKALFLKYAAQEDAENDQTPCGDTLATKRLTAIRPDASELVLWEAENVSD